MGRVIMAGHGKLIEPSVPCQIAIRVPIRRPRILWRGGQATDNCNATQCLRGSKEAAGRNCRFAILQEQPLQLTRLRNRFVAPAIGVKQPGPPIDRKSRPLNSSPYSEPSLPTPL